MMFGLNILLCLELVQLALGELAHQYRYSFYWEYENDALNIFHGPKKIKRFDPARSRLAVLMRGYYEDARIRTKEMNNIRFVIEETFQYEVGYIMHEMYDKYKKLVEQYNKGERNRSLDYLRLYKKKKPHIKRESLIYGNDKIERTEVAQKLYFEIYHLSNMIHEITRKWGVHSKDQAPTFGIPKGYSYDSAYSNAYQEDMQRQKDKYTKKVHKERDRLMRQLYRDRLKNEPQKSSSSSDQFGVDKDGDTATNDFIKGRLRDQGWENWNKARTNGSTWYRPKEFPRDYGWDVPFSPVQG